MANAWGELSWNAGNWGDQNNVTVSVTGLSNSIAQGQAGGFPFPGWGALNWSSGSWGDVQNVSEQLTGYQLNISQGDALGVPNQGWGSDSWGVENWGESGNAVTLTGFELTIDSGQKEAWGQLGWNATNTEWGGSYVPEIAIGQQINASGQQLNISLNNVTELITVDAFPQGIELTTNLGTLDPAPDAEVTGQQLNIGVGTVTAYNEQGWGRDRWGTEAWGAQGIWAFAELNNTNLGLGVTSGVQETWGQDEWGASTTEWGGNSVTDVDISVTVELNTIYDPGWGYVAWGNQTWGQSTEDMALAMPQPGNVDPEPDVSIIGNQINIALGEETITGSANVSLTSLPLEIAQGTAILDALTLVNITGQRLNISLNSVVAGASAEVSPTGNQLTITSGSINVQSWQIVDTGSNVNWNIIDTAA
jgi:hypothetical protein